LKILDNVSSIGNGGGIVASSRMGSTSKETFTNTLNYFFNNSGNFWVTPLTCVKEFAKFPYLIVGNCGTYSVSCLVHLLASWLRRYLIFRLINGWLVSWF
jgi:hypothetical protein